MSRIIIPLLSPAVRNALANRCCCALGHLHFAQMTVGRTLTCRAPPPAFESSSGPSLVSMALRALPAALLTHHTPNGYLHAAQPANQPTSQPANQPTSQPANPALRTQRSPVSAAPFRNIAPFFHFGLLSALCRNPLEQVIPVIIGSRRNSLFLFLSFIFFPFPFLSPDTAILVTCFYGDCLPGIHAMHPHPSLSAPTPFRIRPTGDEPASQNVQFVHQKKRAFVFFCPSLFLDC
ncbi:hypothetical protein ACJBU6_10229 [Exserohilum turcicum]